LAAKNKCLADRNKTRTADEATNERLHPGHHPVVQIGAASALCRAGAVGRRAEFFGPPLVAERRHQRPPLFRSIAKWEPCLIVDEADDALSDNPDLRNVINSGWTAVKA
jgi:hypothetical protein